MGDLGVAVSGDLRRMMGDPGGRRSIEQALPGYLPQQRWFGGKTRQVRDVRFDGWVPLDPDWTAVLGLISVADLEEVTTQHPLLLGVADDGALVEGMGQGSAPRGLLRAVCGERVEGEGLAVVGWGAEAWEREYLRAIDAEQSNSSVVCDDREILKLYRRVVWGTHPEIEMTSALASVGFKEMPGFVSAAWLERPDGAWAGLALLQEFKPGARDCWGLAVEALRVAEGRGGDRLIALLQGIGRTTARMHLALASIEMAGFRAERATPDDIRGWVEETRREARTASEIHTAALGHEAATALAACAVMAAWTGEGDAGLRIRVHGDYHLGQVLQSDETFYVVDFEGEPARSLEERRALQSPLVDVAGMCRSWSYACATAGAENMEAVGRERLLASYTATVEEAGVPLLPGDPNERDRLLSLLELRKAVYELVYELNNRPDWAWIPAGAIGGLVERVAA